MKEYGNNTCAAKIKQLKQFSLNCGGRLTHREGRRVQKLQVSPTAYLMPVKNRNALHPWSNVLYAPSARL